LHRQILTNFRENEVDITLAAPQYVRSYVMRVTLATVAQRVGVSAQTLSNVLNHPAVVAAPTSQRVHDAIRELKYVPHADCRRIRLGIPGFFGILMSEAEVRTRSGEEPVRRVVVGRQLSLGYGGCGPSHPVGKYLLNVGLVVHGKVLVTR
jgi:hypothetical protein